MREQSKAAVRRSLDPFYTTKIFVGDGLDVGGGPDPLSALSHVYQRMGTIIDWDLPQGDAVELATVTRGSLDFISASHVLEHLHNPHVALWNWLGCVKVGGYVIVTVPDWEMYERCHWPSRFSGEHIWAFTTSSVRYDAHVIMVQSYLGEMAKIAEFSLERLLVIRDHWDPAVESDQTLGPAECAIEFVLQRRG